MPNASQTNPTLQTPVSLSPTPLSLGAYGIIAMALAFAGLPLYIYAPDFYATEFGITLVSLGSALLILRILDAVLDPLIGILSDIYRRFRVWILLCGSVLFGMSFYVLFTPHEPSIYSFAVLVFTATLGYSILSINVNTLGGLWGNHLDTHLGNKAGKMTSIVGVREAFSIIGLMSATILPTIFQFSLSKLQSFFYLSVVMICVLAVGTILLLWWYRAHKQLDQHTDIQTQSQTQTNVSLPSSKGVLAKERVFFLSFFLSMLASSIPAVVVLFFIRDLLELEEYTGVFLLVYFASGMLGILVWRVVTRYLDYYQTWLISMAVAVASFIWASMLSAGDMEAYLLICVISGIAFGAQLLLPPAILAQRLAQHKEQNSTLYFGILALCTKFALALASSLSLWYLGTIGFTPDGANTPEALWGVSMTYAVVPSMMSIVTMIIIWKKLL